MKFEMFLCLGFAIFGLIFIVGGFFVDDMIYILIGLVCYNIAFTINNSLKIKPFAKRDLHENE